jgi:hypothetical protein
LAPAGSAPPAPGSIWLRQKQNWGFRKRPVWSLRSCWDIQQSGLSPTSVTLPTFIGFAKVTFREPGSSSSTRPLRFTSLLNRVDWLKPTRQHIRCGIRAPRFRVRIVTASTPLMLAVHAFVTVAASLHAAKIADLDQFLPASRPSISPKSFTTSATLARALSSRSRRNRTAYRRWGGERQGAW